jgi:hypothetical protein
MDVNQLFVGPDARNLYLFTFYTPNGIYMF